MEVYVVGFTYFKNIKCVIDWNSILEDVACTTVNVYVVGIGEAWMYIYVVTLLN